MPENPAKEEKEAVASETPGPEAEVAAEPAKKPVKKAAKSAPKKEALYGGTGRRKDAIARVRLVPGNGNFSINGGRQLKEYFGRDTLCTLVSQPLVVTNTAGRFDVIATIQGGGLSGQAGALRHGIARALLETDGELRADLKKNGFLTRDPRMTERKKYGLKKARKRPQFSKR